MLCIKKWLLILISLLGLSACEKSVEEMHYGQNYLLIAQQENLINYNLDTQKTQWQYQSRFDKNHINRNQFTVNGNSVYMPYESGLIAALDIASGQTLWEKEVDPMCNQSYAMTTDDDAWDIYRPLLMSQATINNNMLYISSTSASSPCLYAFDANTGEKLQASELPSRYNLYAPVANQYGVFTNGALYLSAFASKPYLALYPKGELTFDIPLYAPLQSTGNLLFATTEKQTITAFDIAKTASTSDLPIKWQHSYLDEDGEFSINPRVILKNKWLYMVSYHQDYSVQENDQLVPIYSLILRVIDLKDGDVSLIKSISDVFSTSPETFQVDNRYIVVSTDREIAFIDKKTHRLAAKFIVGHKIPKIDSNIVEKDTNTFVYLSGVKLVELDVSKKTSQITTLTDLNLSAHDTDDAELIKIQLLKK